MKAWLAAAAIVVLGFAPRARAWCQLTTDVTTTPEPGTCLLANPPESFPLVWRRPCTSISLSYALSSRTLAETDVRQVFQRSIDTWRSVDCGGVPMPLDVVLLDETNASTVAATDLHGPNVHAILFVHEGWNVRHNPSAYAVTLVWHDTTSGEIWDADMEINDEENLSRGSFGICPDDGCPMGMVDLQNVVTHEMGHYFGLAHTPDDSLATMFSRAEPREIIKRDLAQDDITGICTMYPVPLEAMCDYTPRFGLRLDGGISSPGCGCRVPGAQSRSDGFLALIAVAIAIGWRRRGRGPISKV